MFVGLLLRMMQRESELRYDGANKTKLCYQQEKCTANYEIMQDKHISVIIFF